ncbi:MAG: stage 0 sporulation family protein [Candidatus Omnitrophica bacterium]|nr:stage 0 sporulation family protein [Candidatus Omnitrophota bacterium]
MYEVVQIRLREAGKISYYSTGGMKFKTGDYVIVESDRGQDYGQVISDLEAILDSDVSEPLKRVIRKANPWDMHQIDKNKKKIKEVMDTCSKKIHERRLSMKLIDAEFTFDRSKIMFYFTAEGRIDFRDLVKDLANVFKTRIELKQIGVRDEAKMLGGFGPCGRVLCCAAFLKDFEPVTIKMAKEQNLPLNPTKISGLCGRLMCCLSYEHKTYTELMKGLPKEDDVLKTEKGPGKVISINAIKRSATVVLEDGSLLEVFYK